MKSQLATGVVLLVAGALVGAEYGGRGDAAPAPQPGQKACLWRLQKQGQDGVLKFKVGPPYQCKHDTMVFETAEGTGDLDLKFRNGDPLCDELPRVNRDAFPEGSRLVVDGGHFIGRKTPNPNNPSLPPTSAVFSGKFTIKEPNGDNVFEGLLDAVLGINPNHAPLPPAFHINNMPCHYTLRLEGSVHGRGVGKAAGLELHAVLVAKLDYRTNECRLNFFTLDGVTIAR
jgi:hypothetical protein